MFYTYESRLTLTVFLSCEHPALPSPSSGGVENTGGSGGCVEYAVGEVEEAVLDWRGGGADGHREGG